MTGVGIDGWMDGWSAARHRCDLHKQRREGGMRWGMGWTDCGEVTSRTVRLLEQTNSA